MTRPTFRSRLVIPVEGSLPKPLAKFSGRTSRRSLPVQDWDYSLSDGSSVNTEEKSRSRATKAKVSGSVFISRMATSERGCYRTEEEKRSSVIRQPGVGQ